jgi:uncharacterized protein (DUF362 family)
MSVLSDKTVIVYCSGEKKYADHAPFHPAIQYPEYSFGDTGSEPNPAYEAVRGCFHTAGLDAGRYGTAEWNPLQDLIQPRETVLLKPNMVHQRHPRDPNGWRYVLTHGSIIRAAADYIWKAIGPKGRIILADAPQTDASFAQIVCVLGLDCIRNFYVNCGLDFELIDLRREEWTARGDVVVGRRLLPPNRYGSIPFDLGRSSELAEHEGAGRYYGADYDAGVVNRHHTGGRHEYLIAACAIECDVVFSLPKLKTHKKAGITASLKNLVGVNADKNWLPHHTDGAPQNGGDEHPCPDFKHRAERRIVAGVRKLSLRVPIVGPWVHRVARSVGRHLFGDTEKTIRSGNWWGNDTIWRMCLDLNKIVLYGNSDGSLRAPSPQNRKRHYVLVDGVLAGQAGGPMNPDPIRSGIVLFGVHPPSVDTVCAYMMGFDPDRIPIVCRSFQCRHFPVSEHAWRDITVRSNVAAWDRRLIEISDEETFHFEPHFGWKGHIERSPLQSAGSTVAATGTDLHIGAVKEL